MARKTSPALTWITSEAKRIRRAHPGKPWSACIKAAGAAYRQKKGGGSPAQKKTGRRPAKRRRISTTGASPAVKATATAAQLRAELRRRLNEQIDKSVVRKYRATKKRDKRKIQKSITAAKSQLRRLS